MARGKASDKLPAGMRQKENGMYELRFTVDGKRYSVTGKTKTECKKRETEKRAEIRLAGYVIDNDATLEEYFKEWQDSRKGSVKESTWINTEQVYNGYFRNTLGSKKLRDIRKEHIIALRKNLCENMKPTSVNSTMTKLKTIFNAAVADEIIIRNPCAGLKALKTDEQTKAVDTIHRALTEDEMGAFLRLLREENSAYYPMFLFSFSTGMRLMEVNALTWRDIHRDKNGEGYIDVNKTLSFRKGKEYAVTAPKTRSSKRKIPFSEPAAEALKHQRELMFMLHGGAAFDPDSRIFQTARGCVFTSECVGYCIKAALKRLDKKESTLNRLHITLAGIRSQRIT